MTVDETVTTPHGQHVSGFGRHRWRGCARTAGVCAWLLALGCGRTEPRDNSVQHASLLAEGGARDCVQHADCEDDSVCIDESCIFFGECLRDAHCHGQRCVDNECVGEAPPAGPPALCEINDDCPDRYYCVDGNCRRGTECLRHAHCSLADVCLGQVCVPLL